MATIACDVDGCLIDYIGAAAEWTGCKKEDATEWDFFKAWGVPGLWKAWDEHVAKPGFCEALRPLGEWVSDHSGPGGCRTYDQESKHFVRKLRLAGHRVIFATSPHKNAPLWKEEREQVLVKWWGANLDDVCLIRDKSLVHADILIDDKPKNVMAFQGPAICFSQPWNHEFVDRARAIDFHQKVRVSGYDETLRMIGEILG